MTLEKITIELTDAQKKRLAPLLKEIEDDAIAHGGTSEKTILAQVMNSWIDAFLYVTVIPKDMTDAIRKITGAENG